MKVIHIAETIKGGVGTCLNVFDSAFDGEDVQALYVVPQQHVDHLAVSGQVITFDRAGRGMSAIRNLIAVARQVVREEKPDVIFFQSTYSLLVMAAFRAMRVPGKYVYNPHGWARLRYDHNPRLQSVVGLIEGRLSRLADRVTNVSENDRKLAKASGYGGRHVVIENAMPDVAPPAPLPEGIFPRDKVNLLFVGRFDRQKGLDVLLDAYERASTKRPDLYLHIIGGAVEDGSEIDPRALPDSITFHGWVTPTEIPSYYAAADLVLMPSRWESLPMVIIEALRGGTPVMLSDICGMGSLIEEGKSGFAVPLEAEAWALAMVNLDTAQLQAMGPAARALFEARYSLERYFAETQSLMDDMTA